MNYFEIVGPIEQIESIAVRNSIRELDRLVAHYGFGRWRKLKGFALVAHPDVVIEQAEVHWCEAHGIGRKEIKIKRILR